MDNRTQSERLTDIVLGLVLLVVGIIFSAFVGMKLWNWFIASTFNIVNITIWQSLGINILISFFTYKKQNLEDKKDTLYPITMSLINGIIASGIFLLLGYIVLQVI